MGWTRADLEQRRTKVAALLLERRSVREIATMLGVAKSTASDDVSALRQEWRTARLGNQDEEVGLELATLDVAQRAIWPGVEAGKYQAIDRLLAIMARRAAYLGLDAPATVKTSGETHILVEHVNDWRPTAHAAPGAADRPA